MNVSSPVHMVGRLLGETAYRSARSNSLSGGHPFSGRFYDVDPVTGFIPSQPLPRLTGEFTLWEDALEDARRVLKLGEDKGEEAQAKRAAGERWRQQLRANSPSMQWPVLDVARLGDKRTIWRRAHYILACLQHFYIHSLPPQPPKTSIIIPKPLAVPLVEVSKKIDLPPILTFADIVLWNWELVNPNEPVSLDNVRFLTLFSGTETEKNFYALSLGAELKGAEMVEIFERFMNLPCLADRSAIATVARDLERLVPIINELSDILQGARSNIDPHIFYWVVRPWWNGSDASRPWVFEGVSPYTSFDLGGASAGQSSVMHALDIFLDVDHGLKQTRQPSPSPENRRADTRFMEKMRRYMPAEHRAYLAQLQTQSLRELVQRTPSLRAPYNAAVEALKKFRDGHIRIGTLYIISQARSIPPASMGGAEAFPQREDRSKGTGGNPVGVLLKAGRDATQRTLLKD
ncbi:Indoleamine 2,3-dioxygenase [Trametes coccinea BRFM310]|uniref:Indoleamine 2,3-dioxygenase n=1 Tax=Trametes coccinea (strain BRFM310) TaxID=1353009 RepID=A0A1Y2J5D0_TRAC3|nr:Indoleamine 2,3-dioxygenase [Trametes coccinea BRFM310]